jgi:hypothetical protein
MGDPRALTQVSVSMTLRLALAGASSANRDQFEGKLVIGHPPGLVRVSGKKWLERRMDAGEWVKCYKARFAVLLLHILASFLTSTVFAT